MNIFICVDLRDRVALTRHQIEFDIPVLASTASNSRNPDKKILREKVLSMRAQGMSYRQIGEAVGLHWTRVGQILRAMN